MTDQELAYDVITTVQTPYGDLSAIDRAIAPIVEALNRIPNVRTTSSCSGHERLRASVLFRAADGDNDALMASPIVRALATRHTPEGEFANARSVTRRLSGWPSATSSQDDFELEFWGWGADDEERRANYYREREAILRLLAEQGGVA